MSSSPPASTDNNSGNDTPVPPPGNGYAPISLKFIFFVSFFFFATYAALLVALNWKRLGKPERFLPTLIVAALLYVIFTLFALFTLSVNALNIYAPLSLLFPLPLGVGTIIIALLWQRPTYMTWVHRYAQERAQLQRYGCFTSIALLIVCAIAGSTLSTYVAVPLYNASGLDAWAESLRPIPTFEGQAVELTYPLGWVEITEANYTEEYRAFCETAYQDCLSAGQTTTGNATFEVVRLYDPLTNGFPLDVVQTGVKQQLRRDGIDIISTSSLIIDGYPAYQIIASPPNNQIWVFILVKPQPNYTLRLALYATNRAAYDATSDDLKTILGRINIITGG